MPDDGPLLLQAILAHPEEDAPRAAFADYLQDQPDAFNQWYGRFIAAQLASRPWEDTLYRDTIVGKSSLELRNYGLRLHPCANTFSHCVTYWGEHTRSNDAPIFDANRGFVCGAELACSDFLKIAAPLFARHPVDRVELTDRSPWGNFTFGTLANPYGWQWSLTWNLRSSYHIPPAIWDLMESPGEASDGVKCFPDAAIASRGLSNACLAFGKRAAADWLLTNTP